MKNYDNVTAKELHDKRMEMLNYLGRTGGGCYSVSCGECPISQAKNGKNVGCSELEAEHFDEYVKIIMEYEPRVDWENVEVDTKIMVRDEKCFEWSPRHFAKFENGEVYAWEFGSTKFTSGGRGKKWKYAKLYKGEEK